MIAAAPMRVFVVDDVGKHPAIYQRPEKPAPVKKSFTRSLSWRPTRTSNCTLGVA